LVIAIDRRCLGTILTDKKATNYGFDVEEKYLYLTNRHKLIRLKLK